MSFERIKVEQFELTPYAHKIPWSWVLDEFKEISSGLVTVEPDGGDTPSLFWKTSDGWRIQVFDDSGSWDYIEHIWASDGRELDYDDIAHAGIDDRIPTEEELRRIWWHPGWMCTCPTERPK